jgi:hypothetical protein
MSNSKKPPKFETSGFGLIDITTGRNALFRRFEKRLPFCGCPENMKIPVIIHANIDGIAGNDDGVSREFTLEILKIEQL